MRYIIDRIEDGLAVCEDELKKMISIPLEKLPGKLHEGDVLREKDGLFSPDPQETKARRAQMRKKLEDLFGG